MISQGPAQPGVQSDGLREPGPPAAGVDHHLGGGEGDAGVHDQPEGRLSQAQGAAVRDLSMQKGARVSEGIHEELSGKLPAVHVRPVSNVRVTVGLGYNFLLTIT